MIDYTIRGFRSVEDAQPQYELWLRATANLPRAWRSSLRNVEYQLSHGPKYPNCRLYAEGNDGELLGYIGAHPPFEWIASQHGPPADSFGWAIPFGFPWTDPLDESLEAALYDEMIRVTPETFAEFQRDVYIQRFRESWSQHIARIEQRGWQQHSRIPLLGRQIDDPGPIHGDLTAVTRDDLALISTLCGVDDTSADKPSTSDLEHRWDDGWIVSDTFSRLGERGAFALEQRGKWAVVTVFVAEPSAWDETLRAAASQARTLGACELYFTIESHDVLRRDALERRGFTVVDAGVYYVRDAD